MSMTNVSRIIHMSVFIQNVRGNVNVSICTVTNFVFDAFLRLCD